MTAEPQRLGAADSALVVIDVQEKLLARMPGAAALVRDVGFLLDAAALLNVPALATEQYPQGLGPTAPELARRLPHPPPQKRCFSSCGAPEFGYELERVGRRKLVLSGMETHVCVLQTALDLLEQGYALFVPVDGVAARGRLDHDVALRRLEREGVTLTTCEAVVFEWLGTSERDEFKAASRLVQDRMRVIGEAASGTDRGTA